MHVLINKNSKLSRATVATVKKWSKPISYAVLHMDKYKKDAIRGIQSHNQRERKSSSNPDIDYERSALNYDLHNAEPISFMDKTQNRIDDMLFTKAVRKDAVYMCGIIISSDTEFFDNLPEAETRRFFKDSYDFMAKFIGQENIISAVVHMDEKTPHMHFMHVPITSDNKLNANKIYTRASLKQLQNEFPAYLQARGFNIERGVEQGKGSSKKHLDTAEFKQQREAISKLKQERNALQNEVAVFHEVAAAGAAMLAKEKRLPMPYVADAKQIHDAACNIIYAQERSLIDKRLVENENINLKKENTCLKEANEKLTAKQTNIDKEIIHRETQYHKAIRDKEIEHQAQIQSHESTITDLKFTVGTLRQENTLLKAAVKETRHFMAQPQIRELYQRYHEEQQKQAKIAAQKLEMQRQMEAEKQRRQERNRGFER